MNSKRSKWRGKKKSEKSSRITARHDVNEVVSISDEEPDGSDKVSYSIVHKIVHFNLRLLVREIFMCFELMILVHASSHSI